LGVKGVGTDVDELEREIEDDEVNRLRTRVTAVDLCLRP
jgi:hypothetical protein